MKDTYVPWDIILKRGDQRLPKIVVVLSEFIHQIILENCKQRYAKNVTFWPLVFPSNLQQASDLRKKNLCIKIYNPEKITATRGFAISWITEKVLKLHISLKTRTHSDHREEEREGEGGKEKVYEAQFFFHTDGNDGYRNSAINLGAVTNHVY